MTVIFSDTFTTAANQNLEAHTPDVGTSWSELWATTVGMGWNVDAASDQLRGDTALNVGAIHTADAAYPSAQYGVTVTMSSLLSSAGFPIYLCVRIQDVANMYAVRLNYGLGTCQLYKKVRGIWTALGSVFDSPANGSVLRLEIVDSTLEFYDDGVLVASVHDADIIASGKAGLGCGGGVELVTATDSVHNLNKLDDFSANLLRERSRVLVPGGRTTTLRGTPPMSLGGDL